MNKDELKTILDAHGKWLRGEPGGKRADLRGADLRGADLSGANLSGCSGNSRVAHALAQMGACGDAIQWVLDTDPAANVYVLYAAARSDWQEWLDGNGGLEHLQQVMA